MTIFIDHSRRRVLGYGAAGAAALGMPSIARAQGQVVRIGLPTKTYYPTIIAETALRQKLFEKEGIKAELTIYRGGAEGFEAMAAGAADVILNSASSVAAGIKKGVMAKNVAGAALGYYGWHLVVKTELARSRTSSELAGKKVGITSAGSGTDILALWTQADRKIDFTRVPLGGGGLVPNLLTGNIDATVLYSPLTYKMFIDKQRAQPDRLRRRGAAAHDRRLDGDRQVHQGQAAGGAEDAQRALRRRSRSCRTRRTAPRPSS